jgi:hypothetical protein
VGVVPEYITWEAVDRIRDEVLRRLSELERSWRLGARRELATSEFFNGLKKIVDEVIKPYCWGDVYARFGLGKVNNRFIVSCRTKGKRGDYELRVEIPLWDFDVDLEKNAIYEFEIDRFRKARVEVRE